MGCSIWQNGIVRSQTNSKRVESAKRNLSDIRPPRRRQSQTKMPICCHRSRARIELLIGQVPLAELCKDKLPLTAIVSEKSGYNGAWARPSRHAPTVTVELSPHKTRTPPATHFSKSSKSTLKRLDPATKGSLDCHKLTAYM